MITKSSKNLVSIGALSKMVGLTTDTLRYYDEIGLLKPTQISDETGYRYYVPLQAVTLVRILELKDFGFSLKEIKTMLTKNDSQLNEVYRLKHADLTQQNKRNQKIMDKLSKKITPWEDEQMNKKVLIVDDAAFMRMMLKDILEKSGYEIIGEAENGEQALQMYKQFQPGAVVLNVVMPQMDGIEALKSIIAHDSAANVIILTALAKTVVVAETLKYGAKFFVAKPFQAETLIDMVRNSFAATSQYNQEYLKNLYNDGKENDDIISQTEIDNIVKNARNLGKTAKVNSANNLGNPSKSTESITILNGLNNPTISTISPNNTPLSAETKIIINQMKEILVRSESVEDAYNAIVASVSNVEDAKIFVGDVSNATDILENSAYKQKIAEMERNKQ